MKRSPEVAVIALWNAGRSITELLVEASSVVDLRSGRALRQAVSQMPLVTHSSTAIARYGGCNASVTASQPCALHAMVNGVVRGRVCTNRTHAER